MSQWVSEWVSDKGKQWSDSGPIKKIRQIVLASEKYIGQIKSRLFDPLKGGEVRTKARRETELHRARPTSMSPGPFYLDFVRVILCLIRHWRDLWSWTLPRGSKISSYLTANSSSPHQTSTQTRKIRSFLTILSTRPSRACSRRWSGVKQNVLLVAGSVHIWHQLRRGRGHLALWPDQTLQGFFSKSSNPTMAIDNCCFALS